MFTSHTHITYTGYLLELHAPNEHIRWSTPWAGLEKFLVTMGGREGGSEGGSRRGRWQLCNCKSFKISEVDVCLLNPLRSPPFFPPLLPGLEPNLQCSLTEGHLTLPLLHFHHHHISTLYTHTVYMDDDVFVKRVRNKFMANKTPGSNLHSNPRPSEY